MAKCPECNSELDFEDNEFNEGGTFSCPDCHASLEVVGTRPVQLVASPGRAEEAGLEVVTKHPVQLAATGSDKLDGEDEISDNGNLA